MTARSTRKRLGIRKPRESGFNKDELRGWSLKVLALMANSRPVLSDGAGSFIA
jgi:hypothetical protein